MSWSEVKEMEAWIALLTARAKWNEQQIEVAKRHIAQLKGEGLYDCLCNTTSKHGRGPNEPRCPLHSGGD